MKIAVLGTGMVGNAIATKLVQLGYQVIVGSRATKSEASERWLRSVGGKAQIGTFADAASLGEIAFDCTNGAHSLSALRLAGTKNLRGKILIQVGNPLDVSNGKPPTLNPCNTDSLGELIQREFPDTRVVKTLNTVNCRVMVEPSLVPGDHSLFICGNDAAAKAEVTKYICEWFGWKSKNVIDLGDISNSRGTEMFLALWVRLWNVLKTPLFNIHIGVGTENAKSISTQNANDSVAVVQRLYDARGNPEIIRQVLATDVRWEVVEGFPHSGVYLGLDGVLDFFKHLSNEFEDWHSEASELFATDGHVTATGVYSAKAKATGKTFQARFTHIWTMRDGVIARLQQVADTVQLTRALEARGEQ